MKKRLLLLAAFVAGALGMRAQTDVTDTYIKNAGFDNPVDFQTGNIATGNSNQRKDVTNWDNEGGGTYSTGGVIQFGSSGQINGSNIPSTNSDGTAEGGALTLNAAWTSNAYYYQDITIPAGNYTFKFKVNNVGQNSNYEKDPTLFSFKTEKNVYSGQVHSYPVNTWTEQTIDFSLAEETTGTLRIGYKSTDASSANTPKLVVDYVKAYYNSNYTSTLQSTIDRATILYARSNDADLHTAMEAAQKVLNEADNTVAYQTTIDEAVVSLREAIKSAASKVVLLENENINFMFENADFESSIPVNVGVTTYDYDCGNNNTSFSQLQTVEGWTNLENGNARSGGAYAFGESAFLGSKDYIAPATPSEEGETRALGVVAVWSAKAQYVQNVTLPAGGYIVEIPIYNTAGTVAFNKNLIGFVEKDGTEHLATAKTYAKGQWVTEKVTFTLDEETEGYFSLGYLAENNGSADMPHLFFDKVKVTYTSLLAVAKTEWDAALQAAQDAVENEEYANVNGEELSALQAEIAKDEPTTVEGYNNATAALQEATAAFIAAKASYDAYQVALNINIPAELPYASETKKAAYEEAMAVEVTTAEAAQNAAEQILKTRRQYVESNALADGIDDAEVVTDLLEGIQAEDNKGWTNGIGTDRRDVEIYTDGDGEPSLKYYDGGWDPNVGVNIEMSRQLTLPAGKYLLTVTARGSELLTEYTMTVGTASYDLPHNGSGVDVGVFGHGWDDASLEFVSDGSPLTLTIKAKSTEKQQWISFNRFRLAKIGKTDVTVGEAGYATYVTPTAVEFGDDVLAFVVTAVENGTAQMVSIESAPEGTPVVIKAAEGTHAFTPVATAEAPKANLLKVAETEITKADDIYVLANLESGVGFYALAADFTLPKGRVYLDASNLESKFIGFDFDEATGINTVEQMANESVVIYNLAGQRVQNPTRGIYIVNGKKVLVK